MPTILTILVVAGLGYLVYHMMKGRQKGGRSRPGGSNQRMTQRRHDSVDHGRKKYRAKHGQDFNKRTGR